MEKNLKLKENEIKLKVYVKQNNIITKFCLRQKTLISIKKQFCKIFCF